uniref:Uncharacterized protein n=1 Tax=Kalanchoe fedtschenkoi TaxID=63787 RepID=A0A7N0SZI7_KALFE
MFDSVELLSLYSASLWTFASPLVLAMNETGFALIFKGIGCHRHHHMLMRDLYRFPHLSLANS